MERTIADLYGEYETAARMAAEADARKRAVRRKIFEHPEFDPNAEIDGVSIAYAPNRKPLPWQAFGLMAERGQLTREEIKAARKALQINRDALAGRQAWVIKELDGMAYAHLDREAFGAADRETKDLIYRTADAAPDAFETILPMSAMLRQGESPAYQLRLKKRKAQASESARDADRSAA